MSGFFNFGLENIHLRNIERQLKTANERLAQNSQVEDDDTDIVVPIDNSEVPEHRKLQVIECEKQTFIENAIDIQTKAPTKELAKMWIAAEQSRINAKWKMWDREIISDDYAHEVVTALFGEKRTQEFDSKYRKKGNK